MARTNIDIDEDACRSVMAGFHPSTKRDAVNVALRLAVVEVLDEDHARAMRGSGWDGDLESMRA